MIHDIEKVRKLTGKLLTTKPWSSQLYEYEYRRLDSYNARKAVAENGCDFKHFAVGVANLMALLTPVDLHPGVFITHKGKELLGAAETFAARVAWMWVEGGYVWENAVILRPMEVVGELEKLHKDVGAPFDSEPWKVQAARWESALT